MREPIVNKIELPTLIIAFRGLFCSEHPNSHRLTGTVVKLSVVLLLREGDSLEITLQTSERGWICMQLTPSDAEMADRVQGTDDDDNYPVNHQKNLSIDSTLPETR